MLRIFGAVSVVVLVVALLLAASFFSFWRAAQPAPDHLARKGTLVEAEQTAEYLLPGGVAREYLLRSDTGLEVEIAVRYPYKPLSYRPLLLLMGGQETGRSAIEVLPETYGATVAAISYPFGTVPHRSMLAVAAALPRIQNGIFNTPAAALLALDYLLEPAAGINPGRVELAGISFGAYLASVPAVLDTRVERLWLIHGGGAPALVLNHGLRKRIPFAGIRSAVAKYLATVAGAEHMGPEAWVGRVSPRPVILVHARSDNDLPPAATAALREAVGEPLEVLWTEGKHVHPKRPEIIEAISELMFERIAGPDVVDES
ncbi:MAG: hypothetical protein AAGI24_11570 [Pseudomonadota bacterium]